MNKKITERKENTLALISREFFQEYKVYKYGFKKIDDMTDNEVIQKCHFFVEENHLINEWWEYSIKREKEIKKDSKINNIEIKKGGSLFIFGQLIGKPKDKFQQVSQVIFDEYNNFLTIELKEEKCTIYEPGDIYSTEDEFFVKTANKVIWTWYSYGSSMKYQYYHNIEYVKINNNKVKKIQDNNEAIIDISNAYAVEIK